MSAPSTPISVLWNPKAGTAAGAAELLEQLQADPSVVIYDTKADELEEVLAQDPFPTERLVVAGGDGTIHAAVQALMQHRRPPTLAVLPIGSGNDFARSLGMPLNARAAWALCRYGHVEPLDLLECTWDSGHEYAVNMVTLGNTGLYLQNLTDEVKRQWGPYCYLRGVVDVAMTLQVFSGQLSLDGGPPGAIEYLNLFVANGRTSGGGMVVAPVARLHDGRCDVIIVRDGAVPDLAALASEYVFGDFVRHPLVDYRQVGTLRLQAAGDLPFTIDGETFTARDLTIKTLPRVLRVAAPAMYASDARRIAAAQSLVPPVGDGSREYQPVPSGG